MNVYLSTASAELSLATGYMDRLEAAGHHVHRWDRDVAAARAAGMTDADLPVDVRDACALGDTEAIDEADIFWLLVPSMPSVGAWIEFGFALGRYDGPRLVVSGDGGRSIFFSPSVFELVTFDDHEAALRWILDQREPGSSER
jgi:hypothetical protein